MGQNQNKDVPADKDQRLQRQYLQALRKFEKTEVSVLEQTFKDLAARSKGTTIDKATFLRIFNLPGMLGERLFHVFARKQNNSIDWHEFICGLGCFARGSFDEKLEFMFHMYALSGDNTISRVDLETMLNSVVSGATKILRTTAKASSDDDSSDEEDAPITSFLEIEVDEPPSLDSSESKRQVITRTESDGSISEKKTHSRQFSALQRHNRTKEKVHHMVENAFKQSNIKVGQKLSLDQFKQWVALHPEVLDIIQNAFPRAYCISPEIVAKTATANCSPRSLSPNPLAHTRRPSLTKPLSLDNDKHPGVTASPREADLKKPSVEVVFNALCEQCGFKVTISHCLTCGGKLQRGRLGSRGHCATCGEIENTVKCCFLCGFPLKRCESTPSNMVVKQPSLLLQTEDESHPPSHEGYLFKVGIMMKQLVSRWIVVKDHFLYSFPQRGELRPSTVMLLDGCYIEMIDHSAENPKFEFGIEIIYSENPRQSRIFYASSKHDRDRWYSVLKHNAGVNNIEDFYELGPIIGEGRFSIVREGVCKANRKQYAIKIIDKNKVEDADKESLTTEIAILKLMDHPNVINLKAVFENRRYMYLVMKLIRGGDLSDRIRSKKRFHRAVAREITFKLLQVVQYLHSRGIVHRDLKPENILCRSQEDWDIVVSDFGLSKFTTPSEILHLPCGSLAYMAPEIFSSKGYDKSVDLWSVGVILYQMIAGELPFYSHNQNNLISQITQGKVSFSQKIWATVSSEVKDLVSNLLVVDPAKRYTADQALGHPWFALTLKETAEHLKLLNASSPPNSAEGEEAI